MKTLFGFRQGVFTAVSTLQLLPASCRCSVHVFQYLCYIDNLPPSLSAGRPAVPLLSVRQMLLHLRQSSSADRLTNQLLANYPNDQRLDSVWGARVSACLVSGHVRQTCHASTYIPTSPRVCPVPSARKRRVSVPRSSPAANVVLISLLLTPGHTLFS